MKLTPLICSVCRRQAAVLLDGICSACYGRPCRIRALLAQEDEHGS